MLLSSGPCYATSSCPPAPRYSETRYDDDFSYLDDLACRTDFWDPVKYIPLDAEKGWYLSLGGEIRERYERFHNPPGGNSLKAPTDICCSAIYFLAIFIWETTYASSLN